MYHYTQILVCNSSLLDVTRGHISNGYHYYVVSLNDACFTIFIQIFSSLDNSRVMYPLANVKYVNYYFLETCTFIFNVFMHLQFFVIFNKVRSDTLL